MPADRGPALPKFAPIKPGSPPTSPKSDYCLTPRSGHHSGSSRDSRAGRSSSRGLPATDQDLSADAKLAMELQMQESLAARRGVPSPTMVGAARGDRSSPSSGVPSPPEPRTPKSPGSGRRSRSREQPNPAQLCSMGCGRRASLGRDGHGVPYTTCCRGCAVSDRHDGRCRGEGEDSPEATTDSRPRTDARGQSLVVGPPIAAGGVGGIGQSDRQMAMALQMEEMQRTVSGSSRLHSNRVSDAVRYASDPVWGEIEFADDENDSRRRRRQRIAAGLFTTCPCVFVTCRCFRSELSRPLSTAEVKLAWSRLLCSFSFIFAIAQVVIFVLLILKYKMDDIKRNPMLGPNYYVLDQNGAKNAARVKYEHEWWRLVTPILLHAGWLHLLSNLLLQMRLSIVLEVLWGHGAWLAIYILSGAYGSIASCIFMPNTLSVGSSGSLCGLIGAWVPFILSTWNQTLPRDLKLRNAQLMLVVSSIVLLVPLGFMPMVDSAAHGGGLMMGVVVACLIFGRRLQTPMWRIATQCFGGFGLVTLISASAYWFWFHTEPSRELLNLCPPPGCIIYVIDNSSTAPAR